MSEKIRIGEHSQKCSHCKEAAKRGGWDEIDLAIWHANGHVWPGFAGEPGPGFYGGSDF